MYMILPQLPEHESRRLEQLSEYDILDTLPEDIYDEITLLAATICNTPISLISFVDEGRQWFKSHFGLSVTQTPREISFCAHAIITPQHPFIINDSRKDKRFADNPLVINEPQFIFYAGVPLVTHTGDALGTLCVVDSKAHKLSDKQIKALQILGKQVMTQLELRKKNAFLSNMYDELLENYEDVEQFSYTAAHDLRNPLHNITSLVSFLKEDEDNKFTEESKLYLEHINTSANQLSKLVDEILEFSKATQIVSVKKDLFSLKELVLQIWSFLKVPENITLELPDEDYNIFLSKVALKQILTNLIGNAIKFIDKEKGVVIVNYREENNFYYIDVTDNGHGIPDEDMPYIFDLFRTVKLHRNKGTGIGLSIVYKLVKKLRGTINVTSKVNVGTSFSMIIKK